MKEQNKNQTPQGYSTVCPYLMVKSVEAQIDFLVNVFQAEVKEEMKAKEGELRHGEVRIGDSVIMMGKSREEYPSRKSMNYIFVQDVDTAYNKALELGAKSVMEPTDQYYGHRDAGIEDPQGNEWWIGQQIENLTAEELQQRMDEQNT